MKCALKVKNIDSSIHKSIEFICVSIYFSDVLKNDIATLVFIIKEIHSIDDLKVKMLIDNHFLDSEKFFIDIENKTTIIENCKIDISLKIQSKDLYVRKKMHVQHVMIFQLNEKQFMIIKVKISDKRNFFSNSISK